jgi:hypothetical protein
LAGCDGARFSSWPPGLDGLPGAASSMLPQAGSSKLSPPPSFLFFSFGI